MEKAITSTLSDEAKERMHFEELYEGYCIELINMLSDQLKFKYKFHLVGDRKYGSFKNGEWNGMIRELRDQVYSLKITSLSGLSG